MKNDAFEVVGAGATKDRLGRVKRDHGTRTALIARFSTCSLSQAAFCRREGINATTFSGWLRDERRPPSDARCARSSSSYTSDTAHAPEPTSYTKDDHGRTTQPAFRELTVATPARTTPASIIVIFGGAEARCADAASAASLMKLLREA